MIGPLPRAAKEIGRCDLTDSAGTAMERGVAKWFDSRMGYGFVIDAAGRDVFLHRRVLRRAGRRKLDPGQPVEFEAEVTPRGIKITHLVVLEHPPRRQGD